MPRSNACPKCGRSRSSARHQTQCLGKSKASVRRARRGRAQTFSKVSGGVLGFSSQAKVYSLANGDFFADRREPELEVSCVAAA